LKLISACSLRMKLCQKVSLLRIKLGNGLVPLNLLFLLLIAVIILLPTTSFRIVIGIPLLLFLPGYTLLTALYPKKEGIDAIERVALSFGLSIALVPLIGLILNYTRWGVNTESILYSVALFMVITSIVAMVRRRRLEEQQRFCIDFCLKLPGWGGGVLNRSLSIILLVSILGVLGALSYAIVVPNPGERFTEFYILGVGGETQGYPEEFVMDGDKVALVRYGGAETPVAGGDGGWVILGVINHEYETTAYVVRVMIDEEPVSIYFDKAEMGEIGPIELTHDGKWEREIGFMPHHIGDNQKVEFMLYKGADLCVEASTHLWINVKEQG